MVCDVCVKTVQTHGISKCLVNGCERMFNMDHYGIEGFEPSPYYSIMEPRQLLTRLGLNMSCSSTRSPVNVRKCAEPVPGCCFPCFVWNHPRGLRRRAFCRRKMRTSFSERRSLGTGLHRFTKIAISPIYGSIPTLLIIIVTCYNHNMGHCLKQRQVSPCQDGSA